MQLTSGAWPGRPARRVCAHQLTDGAVQPLPHPRYAHHAAAAAGLDGNAVGLQAGRDRLQELLHVGLHTGASGLHGSDASLPGVMASLLLFALPTVTPEAGWRSVRDICRQD